MLLKIVLIGILIVQNEYDERERDIFSFYNLLLTYLKSIGLKNYNGTIL
jgi:hypothetical protein